MTSTYQPALAGAAATSTAPAPGRAARTRRRARDWAVDSTAMVLAAGISFMTAEPVVTDPRMTELMVFGDLLLGGAMCLVLWLRRRWPMQVAVIALLLSTFSHFVVGPSLVAVFSVAVHRQLRPVVTIGALALACGAVNSAVHPDPDLGYLGAWITGAVFYSTVIGWGMFVRSRRQLVVSLRERAQRAESEAALRAERAQRLTRERIAREMHDVLAHRLSLLSVHAGALEYRPDAPPRDVAQAAGVIRASAHQALEDLREVIGVLRAPIGDPGPAAGAAHAEGPPDGARPSGGARSSTAGSPAGGVPDDVPDGLLDDVPAADRAPLAPAGPEAVPYRPQPTLADLPRLVGESRQAAMRVALHDETDGPGPVPDATGRTAYRIVQEGLTNARKHAPDAAVSVRVTGGPGTGLTVEVRDAGPERGAARTGRGRPAIPGSGQGLIGLAERASLAGGRVTSGATEDGGFLLRAWLPWPA
ncbi:histidine kinase [Streptomyces sp. HSW2009]|uniref:sensor histidine kinase n=1 Tax=Streptomyces sp. HSW2009 TaxID=3142890 RepID=UPI0032EE221E